MPVVAARRLPLALAAALSLAASVLAACGGGDAGSAADRVDWSAKTIAKSQQGVPLVAILVNSQNVGVGPTRLAFGLLRQDQTLVDGAAVTLRLFRLAPEPDQRPAVAEAAGTLTLRPVGLVPSNDHIHQDGTVHRHQGERATMYVANSTLDRTGWWGAALDIEVEGRRYEDLRLRFWVRERTSEPAIGQPAIPSRQRTVADAPLEEIDSARPPNRALHTQTIAEALTKGRPVVIAFVTPAFCQTRFCGPVLESVVLPAWQRYRDRVEFVHVEPFDLRRAREGQLVPVDAVREWGLLSEPFIVVTDARGTITAKFEGIVDLAELTEAIEAALSGGGSSRR